jgi:hypothetical protein
VQQFLPENQHRRPVLEDERSFREVVESRVMEAARATGRVPPFAVQPPVDRVGAALTVEVEPQRREPVVVLASALGARAVTGRERRRLVEEEELREAPGTHERRTAATAELQAARDPAPHLVRPADAAVRVVQAATVAVDEAAGRIRDQFSERSHSGPQRHPLVRYSS